MSSTLGRMRTATDSERRVNWRTSARGELVEPRALRSSVDRLRTSGTPMQVLIGITLGRRWVALAFAGFGLAAVVRNPDPADNLARVRLVVTTTAASAAITVDGATIASYVSSVLDGPPAVSASLTGRTLLLSRNVAGQSAEARFDVILADVAPDAPIGWNLTAGSAADTRVELYSLNDFNSTLVDRFTSTETRARFTVSSALLNSRGRIQVSPPIPRLVLAHYHPW